MEIPFEDEYTDVVRKAQRGLGLKDIDLMMHSGVSMIALVHFLEGNFDPDTAQRLAEVLQLDPKSLIALGEKKITPPTIQSHSIIQWVLPFPSPAFPEQTVNAFTLKLAKETNLLIDTGLNLQPVIEGYKKNNLNPPSAILITHHDHDHINGMEQALEQWPEVPIYAPEAELLPASRPLPSDWKIRIADHTIEIRLTPGHRPEAVTYCCTLNDQSIAFVGDAVFAASIGKIPQTAYLSGLQAIRDQILTLPPATIICPGHGPLTTIEQEQRTNPFFAQSTD